MTVKKRLATTDKKPIVPMIPSQPAKKAGNRCRYLGDDDSPCPTWQLEQVTSANNTPTGSMLTWQFTKQ